MPKFSKENQPERRGRMWGSTRQRMAIERLGLKEEDIEDLHWAVMLNHNTHPVFKKLTELFGEQYDISKINISMLVNFYNRQTPAKKPEEPKTYIELVPKDLSTIDKMKFIQEAMLNGDIAVEDAEKMTLVLSEVSGRIEEQKELDEYHKQNEV